MFNFSATKHKKSLDEVAKNENLKVPVIDTLKTDKIIDSLNIENNILKPLKDKNILQEEDINNLAELDSIIKSESKGDNPFFDFNVKSANQPDLYCIMPSNIFNKMIKSSLSDQVSMLCISIFIQWSKGILFLTKPAIYK